MAISERGCSIGASCDQAPLPGAAVGAVDGSALPNVIAVHPIGGTVLVADRNSGVWMVQLVPRP